MIYLKNFMIKKDSIIAVGKTDITENSYVIQIYTKEHENPIILCYDNVEERNDDIKNIRMHWAPVCCESVGV